MALSGISQTTDTSAYQSYAPAPTTVFTTEGLPGTAAPVIAKADAPVATSTESTESGELASIIANLGKSYAGAQTYNAAGLLNAAALSGQAPAPESVREAPAYEQDLTDLAVINADAGSISDGTSGIYTPSGDLQDLPLFALNLRSNGGIVNTQA